MKFTDGQWLLQPGVSSHYATETYAVQCHADRVVVLATTRPIKHRGDTLAGPTLTLTLSSPLPGVIRVAVAHYSASEPPRLHVPMPGATHPDVQIVESGTEVTLRSGPISAVLKKGEGWRLSFRETVDGLELTCSDWRSLGTARSSRTSTRSGAPPARRPTSACPSTSGSQSRVHCWLAESKQAYWMTDAPSSLFARSTSTHSPL